MWPRSSWSIKMRLFPHSHRLSSQRSIVGWICWLRLFYWGSVGLILMLSQNIDTERYKSIRERWFPEGSEIFATQFATWDASHYLYLSRNGYSKDLASCAFYPLWPLLVRWMSPLAGGNHLVSGMVLANLFSLVACVLFYQQVQERWGHVVSRWALVFFILFPGSLFFQFVYSESLFILLVIGLWHSLEHRRYGLVAITAFLLPLSRAIGVFSLLPIGWHALSVAPPIRLSKMLQRQRWSQWITSRVSGLRPAAMPISQALQIVSDSGYHSSRRGAFVWLLMGLPLLGWAWYLTLMWHWTGNPFEGFVAQKHWNVHSISNLWNFPKFVMELFSPTAWHEFRGSLLDRCVFVMLLYCLPVIWKLDKSLFAWTWMLGIIPAMSGTFTSFTRFASCAFPIFIALAVFLNQPKWAWLKWSLLSVFVVLHGILVWRFVNFRWAG
jgi:hypothetical protein